MTTPTRISSFQKDLLSICGQWPAASACTGCCRRLAADDLPPACRELLDHRLHMTTTLERVYGEPVDLHVLEESRTGGYYQRQILLRLRTARTIVEFGIARLVLDRIPKQVREEVLNHDAPLGDILIRHDVMREIEPRWFFAVDERCAWRAHFDSSYDGPLYGRLGDIRCNGVSAIEVLEIVSPRTSWRDAPGVAFQ